MKDGFAGAMLEATRLTRAGRVAEATAKLRRLLGRHEDAGDAHPEGRHFPPTIDGTAEEVGLAEAQYSTQAGADASVGRPSVGPARESPPPSAPKGLSSLFHRIAGDGFQLLGGGQGYPSSGAAPSPNPGTGSARSRAAMPGPGARAAPASGGQFLAALFTNHAGTRPYKLYVPGGYRSGDPVPLIVMLHGCTQSPDDFAAGTRMNDAAEEHTCLVVYPGQTSAANMRKCWNWFNEADQRRGEGEPSLIAGITRTVMRDYSIDPHRVYVAGMSAGGAAAAIMGATYPDLYAAIGVHSGLPCGAARDVTLALAAMRRGSVGDSADAAGAARAGKRLVPVIVFHGDRDTTVNPRNGDAVVTQSAHLAALKVRTENCRVPGGHAYRRSVHTDASGRTAIEQWVVLGAGHAWCGGSPEGSYTDPRGPDATREMLRFFLEHPHGDGESRTRW